MKSLYKLSAFVGALSLLGSASAAELLWDNGGPNGTTGLNNAYETVLDDFYVPGAGWFVDSAETVGIFLNPGRVVTDVEITFWPHDYTSNSPNGDATLSPAVFNFTALKTGVQWQGYDEIQIAVDFEKTYLDGQNYWWIEFDITDQYGQRIKLLDRMPVNFEPAHVRSNPYPYSTGDKDLAFTLSGTDIKTVGWAGAINDYVLEKIDPGSQVYTLNLVGYSQGFDDGVYQMKLVRNTPKLYRIDQKGATEVAFKSRAPDPHGLHTPVGDDMCPDGPEGLAQFCQSLVACAAYDLFCPW